MSLFPSARRGVFTPRLAAGLVTSLTGLALLAGAPAVLAQNGSQTSSETPGNNADNQPGQPLNTPPEAKGKMAKAVARRLEALTTDNEQIKAIKAFYQGNAYALAWFDKDGAPTDNARDFWQAIDRVSDQGLNPATYRDDRLGQVFTDNRRPGSPDQLADLDVDLSERFIALAHDLHSGVIDDPAIHVQWQEPKQPLDFKSALKAASQGNAAGKLADLAPQQPEYQALVKALARYQAIADQGGWPQIAEGEVLREGMKDPRITTLWQRLQVTGDAPDNIPAPKTYDSTIMSAMKHFQTRNGLKVDGLLGPSTRDALNVSAAERVDDIKLNMERWRWMPVSFGKRYIAVNVPAFELDAHDADGHDLSMKVIVGGSYNDKETPIFGDSMQYLVFRPFWNVPPSIAENEIVPEQRKNPNYLASKNYQIVRRFGPNAEPMAVTPANINAVARGDLLIRQAGGPNNALGLVKFIFPNDMAIYLHSTAATQLFDKTERDLSHGCVRVENPIALATFALNGDPEWSRADIDRAMHSGGRKRVDLPASIPVYMLYWTAFVEDDTVNFLADLYDEDDKLDSALKTKSAVSL